MKNAIKDINKKLTEANILVKKYSKALKTLQDVCEHNWEYQGHSHNDAAYQCSICGEMKFE